MCRSKYKAEDKIKLVKACISGVIGQTEAGKQIGADKSMIRDRIRQYVEGYAEFLHVWEKKAVF